MFSQPHQCKIVFIRAIDFAQKKGATISGNRGGGGGGGGEESMFALYRFFLASCKYCISILVSTR